MQIWNKCFYLAYYRHGVNFTTWISLVSSAKTSTSRAGATSVLWDRRWWDSSIWHPVPCRTEFLLQDGSVQPLLHVASGLSSAPCSITHAPCPHTAPRTCAGGLRCGRAARHAGFPGGHAWRMDGHAGAAASWDRVATGGVGRRNTAIQYQMIRCGGGPLGSQMQQGKVLAGREPCVEKEEHKEWERTSLAVFALIKEIVMGWVWHRRPTTNGPTERGFRQQPH